MSATHLLFQSDCLFDPTLVSCVLQTTIDSKPLSENIFAHKTQTSLKILERANCNIEEVEKVYVSNIIILMKIDTCLHVLFLQHSKDFQDYKPF